MFPEPLRRFLFPRLNRPFVLRLVGGAAAAVILFTQLLLPLRIEGRSMEPTYRDGGLAFCWRLRYLFTGPGHGEVVAIRLAGERVLLLKRVIALAGDTVEFRHGVLFRNGIRIDEPYAAAGSDWQLPARQVEPGRVYVVGDNRRVPMDRHHFGQVDRQRIIGGPVW